MPSRHSVSSFDEEQMLGRMRDLAAQVELLEQELARTHRLAMLGTIAGTIAHEFNNLLTPVMSYAQLALHDMDDRTMVEKALRKAIDTTDKAAQIASSLLGFVREGPEEESADVREALDEMFSCMARSPEKDGIRMTIDVEPGCRVAIRPVALQQVFLNLILNACEAMRPRTGRLTIRSRRSTWNNAEGSPVRGLSIEVADTGRGIDPDRLDSIFQPFVTSRAEGSVGTGLGLPICRRLIESAGGSISATSTVGEGTTFTVLLPEAVPQPAERHAA